MLLRLIVVLAFIAAFSACREKDTVFIKKIDNSSAKSIIFYFHGDINKASYGDSVLVSAGELKELSYHREENSTVSTQQPCVVYDDSIQVVITGGGTLNKQLTVESSWTYSAAANGNQTCTFEITDADIN